jgi:hypothetical protein
MPPDLLVEVEAFAQRNGLALAPALRLLVSRALRAGASSSSPDQSGESPATLAALFAAEHAVLLVASVFPDGERRMHQLADRAAAAAEDRLALFRGPLKEEDSR